MPPKEKYTSSCQVPISPEVFSAYLAHLLRDSVRRGLTLWPLVDGTAHPLPLSVVPWPRQAMVSWLDATGKSADVMRFDHILRGKQVISVVHVIYIYNCMCIYIYIYIYIYIQVQSCSQNLDSIKSILWDGHQPIPERDSQYNQRKDSHCGMDDHNQCTMLWPWHIWVFPNYRWPNKPKANHVPIEVPERVVLEAPIFARL